MMNGSTFPDNICDQAGVMYVILGALGLLFVVVVIIFLMLIYICCKYTKKIKMLQQQNSTLAGLEFRDRENVYINGNAIQSVAENEEETDLNRDDMSDQNHNEEEHHQQETYHNESHNYSEIQMPDKNELEKYCDINPLSIHVAATSGIGSNDTSEDNEDSIVGQLPSKPEIVVYSTLTDDIVPSHKKLPKPKKGLMTAGLPNYETIEVKKLEVQEISTKAPHQATAGGSNYETIEEKKSEEQETSTKTPYQATADGGNYDTIKEKNLEVQETSTKAPHQGTAGGEKLEVVDMGIVKPKLTVTKKHANSRVHYSDIAKASDKSKLAEMVELGLIKRTSTKKRADCRVLYDDIITTNGEDKPEKPKPTTKICANSRVHYNDIATANGDDKPQVVDTSIMKPRPTTKIRANSRVHYDDIATADGDDKPQVVDVSTVKPRPMKKRANSRVDYDDVVVPFVPRSGSEVARERRRIDLTSSQPIRPGPLTNSSSSTSSGATENPTSTYSSLIHIELMKRAQENENKTKKGAAVYSTLTGTPERFKRMPKDCT